MEDDDSRLTIVSDPFLAVFFGPLDSLDSFDSFADLEVVKALVAFEEPDASSTIVGSISVMKENTSLVVSASLFLNGLNASRKKRTGTWRCLFLNDGPQLAFNLAHVLRWLQEGIHKLLDFFVL